MLNAAIAAGPTIKLKNKFFKNYLTNHYFYDIIYIEVKEKTIKPERV